MNDFGHHHARRLALCLTLILCGLTGVVLVVADEMRHTVILPPPPTPGTTNSRPDHLRPGVSGSQTG